MELGRASCGPASCSTSSSPTPGWLARMSQASTAREEAEVQNVARFFRRIQDATKALPRRPRARVREAPRRADRRRRRSGRGRGGRRRRRRSACSPCTRPRGSSSRWCSWSGWCRASSPGRAAAMPSSCPTSSSGTGRRRGDFHPQEERRLFYVAHDAGATESCSSPQRARLRRRARRARSSQFVLEALDLPTDAARPCKARRWRRSSGSRRRPRPGARRRAAARPRRRAELSHRQVDDYQTCPLKYRYVHVLRVPILRHHTVVYGRRSTAWSSTICAAARPALHVARGPPGRRTTASGGTRASSPGSTRRRGKAAGREAITALLARGGGVGHAADLHRAGFRRGSPSGRTIRVRGRFDRVDETDGAP